MYRNTRKILFVLPIVLLAILMLTAPALADPPDGKNGEPPVMPPHANAFGKSYGAWSAEWWQWAHGLPADETHPLIADGQMDCSLGQEGKVWFLGGTYGAGPDPNDPRVILGEANRECTVPTGKALFFPIINVICSEPTGDGAIEEAWRASCEFAVSTFVDPDDLSAKIDGVEIGNLQEYRVTESPLFEVGPLPDPNLLDPALAGETIEAVTDGYYLLLPPLSKGNHTIEFEGQVVVPGVFTFKVDISYDLTVTDVK